MNRSFFCICLGEVPVFKALIGMLFFTVLFSLPKQSHSQHTDTLYAIIDMSQPLKLGWFNPDSDKAGLRGGQLPLTWSETHTATDKRKSGLYETRIPFRYSGDSLELSFKIKVDGPGNPDDGWQKGRNHRYVLYPGKQDSIFVAWQDEAPPPPSSVSGTVEIIKTFDSTPLLNRDLHIYLPPGYDSSNQKYPVLYMHDGQMLFDAAVAGAEWRMDESAQKLISKGKIEPLIIVGIGNTKNRIDEYTPTRQIWVHQLKRVADINSKGNLKAYSGSYITEENDSVHFRAEGKKLFANIPGSDRWQELTSENDTSFYLPGAGISYYFHPRKGQSDSVIAKKPPMGGQGKLYSDYIIKRVKPFIDEHLRTLPDAKNTALGGSSLGGLISLEVGLKNPDIFGKLLIASPSLWWDNQYMLKTIEKEINHTHQKVWLYAGTGEGAETVSNVETLYKIMLEKGWNKSQLELVITKGQGHNERAWARQADNMLLFLFGN